jgi:hypothetical protein
MSSIQDLIKEAYEKKDWGLVAIVYQNLTGIKLTSNEAQAAIYNPRQQYQPTYPAPQQQIIQNPNDGYSMPIKENRKPDRLLGPIDTTKSGFNMFNDDGKEFLEDKKIDQILCQSNPTARGVRGSDMVNVICRQCNRPRTVSQAVVSNRKRFLCDECINRQH